MKSLSLGLTVIIFLIAYFVFSNVGTIATKIARGETGSKVFTVNERPYNQTYASWAAKWWLWHLSIPDNEQNKSQAHPRNFYSPEKCSWKQNLSSPVWMLPDGMALNDLTNPEVRECNVPAGKAILVQIIGSGCSTVEGYKTDKELIDCAIWVLPTDKWSAKIDGVEVMNTEKNPTDRDKFYVQPFFTNLTYVKDNIYSYTPGTYKGTVAGTYLFIPPLPEGQHEIEFKESAINVLDSTGNDKRLSFVKYILNVGNNSIK